MGALDSIYLGKWEIVFLLFMILLIGVISLIKYLMSGI